MAIVSAMVATTTTAHRTFDVLTFTISCIPPVIVILYFAFSTRAKAVLVQPWEDHSIREEQGARSRRLWDPKSASFWMRLLIYFFVFSILGHWIFIFATYNIDLDTLMPGSGLSIDVSNK